MINQLLERIKPYEACCKKEFFLRQFKVHPKLLEDLQELIKNNEEWVTRAKNEDVFFILVDCDWKYKNSPLKKKPSISILFVGPDSVPVIEIFL